MFILNHRLLLMKFSEIPNTKFSLIIKKFISSKIYPFLIGVICYFSWANNLAMIGLSILTLFLVVTLITQSNTFYCLPILLMAFYMFPNFKTQYYFAGIHLGLIVLAIFFNIFAYKRKIQKDKLYYSILGTFLAGIIGGIIYTTMTYGFLKYFKDVLFMFFLTISFAGGYLFLNNTVSLENLKIDYKKYFAISILMVALLLIAQMLTYYLRVENIPDAIANKTLRLGWGNTNTLAAIFMMTIPFTLYLSSCYKYGAFFSVLAFVEYTAIWITHSRGCILISTPILILYLLYLIIKTKNVNRYILIANMVIFLSAALIFVIIFKDKFYEYFGKIFQKGFDDSGRFGLYKEAWDLFKKHFIFGTGYYYKTDQTKSFMYMFHSTPLQIAANLGIIGIIAFGYFYFQKYLILIKNLKCPMGVAMLVAILSLELYGLIDVMLVVYYIAITTLIMLIIAQKNVINQKHEKITEEKNDRNFKIN